MIKESGGFIFCDFHKFRTEDLDMLMNRFLL